MTASPFAKKKLADYQAAAKERDMATTDGYRNACAKQADRLWAEYIAICDAEMKIKQEATT